MADSKNKSSSPLSAVRTLSPVTDNQAAQKGKPISPLSTSGKIDMSKPLERKTMGSSPSKLSATKPFLTTPNTQKQTQSQTTARKPAPARRMPAHIAALRKPANFSSTPFWTGLILSVAWVAFVAFALMQSGASHSFAGIPLTTWAIGICAIISPIAMIWMITAYLQRAADVQSVAEPLRRQLMMITGESGAAEVRIRRFNQAIKEQLSLLRSTQSLNQSDLMSILDKVRIHKEELEQFEQHSVGQVKEIQDVIRRSMQHIEQIMEDKFTMLRVLDSKLSQSGDGVARQTDSVRDQLDSILNEIQDNALTVSSALESAMTNSKQLSDTARSQESSLLGAAESACSSLADLSGKIDTNIAHFLERAGSAREEAERLAGALDSQTRALDDISTNMPTRVSETEAVLRGVADRLYASEQLAREQAINLSDKLSEQIDNLQAFLDNFTAQVGSVDSSLDERRSDLDLVLGRITETTDDLAYKFESSITNLEESSQNSLQRFVTINKDAKESSIEIAERLAKAALKYEETAERVGFLSDENKEKMRIISDDIQSQLIQFEDLHLASQKAGQEVENRSSAALQNMQQVLERLVQTKEATQNIGESLTEKLRSAVDHNERIITRINEATQMTVRSVTLATEALEEKETAIADGAELAGSAIQETIAAFENKAQNAETTLRAQNEALRALLKETEEKMATTEANLQRFAEEAPIPVAEAMAKINDSTTTGSNSLEKYSTSMQDHLSHLQSLNVRVKDMGDELGSMTSNTLTSIEDLNNRYLSVRIEQEDIAKTTIGEFNKAADRLQDEVSLLGDQTTTAVSTLQDAAAQVREESEKLNAEAQESSAKIQTATMALQTEASAVRSMLQQQAENLGKDLEKSEKDFEYLGEILKQKTDAAYSLLDRMANHYNDITASTTQDFEEKAALLAQKAGDAQSKVQNLSESLANQLSQISTGSRDLETHAKTISASNIDTLDQLETINHAFKTTHETTMDQTTEILSRMNQTNQAFLDQKETLGDVAENAISMIQKTGSSFAEQTSLLLTASSQIEEKISNLNKATSDLAEKSEETRTLLEEQSKQLVTDLQQALNQLDVSKDKFTETTQTATKQAQNTASAFEEMTGKASSVVNMCGQDISSVTQNAEKTLGALGASVTRQVASLNLVSDQISEQYKTLSSESEQQKTQLVDLFVKLGNAHQQASDVANKTIMNLTASVQKIHEHIITLGDGSQNVLAQVSTAGSDFAAQSTLLLKSAQQAENQAQSILSVTSTLQNQASQLQEALKNEGQKTGTILEGLLTQLISGKTDLQELGSTADLIMTTMANSVSEQTSSLDKTMDQIAERQDNLTMSLNAQRDTLNTLIARLNTAQEETATKAEETANSLQESAGHITRQMQGIDTQAQSTLVSIGNAVTDYTKHSETFRHEALEAEKQSASLMASANKMQNEAQTLRSSMQSESTHILEQLSDVVSQLDEASKTLKQQTSLATHSLDETLLHVDNVTRTSSEALQERVGLIATAAENTEQRIKTATDQLGDYTQKVEQAGNATDDKARQLAETADYASTNLSSLSSNLAQTDQEARDILERTSARIESVKTALQKEIDHIAETSHKAITQIDGASENLIKESNTLRANLAVSESALNEAANLVREETIQMPAVLNRGVADMANARQAIKDQTDEAHKDMLSTADRFIRITGSVRDTMMDEMTNLNTITDAAEQTLESFNRALDTQIKSICEGAGQLSEEQTNMISKAMETVSQLNNARDRLSQLHIDTVQTTENLTSAFDQIETRAGEATTRLEQVGSGLSKHVKDLANVTDQAESRMLSATQSFRDQMERVRAGVETQISDINQGLVQITTQLEKTSGTLRDATTSSMEDVGRMASTFDVTGQETVSQLTDRTARMRAATEEVGNLLNGFGDQIDGLLNRLSLAGNDMKRNENDLVDRLQNALAHLGGISEKLESNRILTADVSDEAISRLTEVSQSIEKQMGALKDGSETVKGIVHDVSKSHTEQAQNVNRSVVEAQSQVLVMSKSIDEMQKRTDRLRVALKLQGEDLLSSVEDILAQLTGTGDAMGDAVDQVLQKQAEDHLEKMG